MTGSSALSLSLPVPVPIDVAAVRLGRFEVGHHTRLRLLDALERPDLGADVRPTGQARAAAVCAENSPGRTESPKERPLPWESGPGSYILS